MNLTNEAPDASYTSDSLRKYKFLRKSRRSKGLLLS